MPTAALNASAQGSGSSSDVPQLPGVSPALTNLMNSDGGNQQSYAPQPTDDSSYGDGALSPARASYDQSVSKKMSAINRAMDMLSGNFGDNTNLPLMSAAAGALQPTRTPGPGEAIGNAFGSYAQRIADQRKMQQQLAETIPSMQGTDIENQMKQMQVDNYRRLAGTMFPGGASSPQAPAGNNFPANTMSSPQTPSSASSSDGTPMSAPNMGAPSLGAPHNSSSTGLPNSGGAAPLFNVSSLYEQYKLAAITPGMSALAGQLLTELNKGVPEGYYLGQDGALHLRTGFVEGQEQSAEAKAYGASRFPTRPAYEQAGLGPNGKPIAYNKFTNKYEEVGSGSSGNDGNVAGGIPLSSWASQMQQRENNTGNPTASNPLSSATGNGQFIDSTWLQQAKTLMPNVVSGMADKQILQLRNDPAFSQEMTEAYAKQNGGQLTQFGQPVNATTLALAHRFGAQGANTILNAPPNAPLSNLLSPAIIKANPDLANQTTGQYTHQLATQFGTAPVNIGQSQQDIRPLSAEEKVLQDKILPEQFEKAKENYDSAEGLKLQLQQMQDQLGQLGTSGFMSPGTGGAERAAFAKHMNSLAKSYLGLDDKSLPFDPNKVASAEDIMKGTTRLGFDLARQLGSREAMMVVQQAVGAVPGIENTPRGAKLVFGSLNSAAQRQQDYYEYLQNWAQTHPNTMGADVAFNKAYPVEHYATAALLSGVPQKYVANLKAHPETARDFDAYYGKGLSSVVLGRQQ